MYGKIFLSTYITIKISGLKEKIKNNKITYVKNTVGSSKLVIKYNGTLKILFEIRIAIGIATYNKRI